jgi:hypothetical protein
MNAAPEICLLQIKGLASEDRSPMAARVGQRIDAVLKEANKQTTQTNKQTIFVAFSPQANYTD